MLARSDLGPADGTGRSQTQQQLALRRTVRLDEQGLVDRLVRHPAGVILRTAELLPAGDLLGRPVLGELARDELAQRWVQSELAPLRASGVIPSSPVSLSGAISASPAMTCYLATDRRGRPWAAAAQSLWRSNRNQRQTPLVSDAVVSGDRRAYLVALVTLDGDAAARLAAGIGFRADPATMRHDGRVRAEIQAASTLSSAFRVGRADQAPRDPRARFLQPAGELTPTMKVKRPVVYACYHEILDGLYA